MGRTINFQRGPGESWDANSKNNQNRPTQTDLLSKIQEKEHLKKQQQSKNFEQINSLNIH